MDDQARLRQLWRQHSNARAKAFKRWADAGYPWDAKPDASPMPDELRGLSCGAKTRAGTPCKLTSLYDNGRCKFHGGMSTGATTEAGKRKVTANLPGKARERLTIVESQSP